MNRYSMASHNRKNHQRWLNKCCREMNRNIYEDDLWLGRFVVEQKSSWMEWFEDGSGGMLHTHLQFRDKKTGQTKDWWGSCLSLEWKMWWEMNKFITEDCDVWRKEPDIRENRIDFRNVH